jgi:hypothetical protein
MQVYGMNMRLYNMWKLRDDQRDELARLWRKWCQSRRALSVEFGSAMHALASDLTDTSAVNPHSKSGSAAEHVQKFDLAEGSSGVGGDPLWLQGLVGVSGEATSKAVGALRALREVHEHDAQIFEDFQWMRALPTWFLTVDHHLLFAETVVQHGVGEVDFFVLCQAASQSRRRDELTALLANTAAANT